MATGMPAGRSRPPAARAVVGLADGDAAAADMLAVHALDGVVHRLLVLELHPPEAAGPPRLRIHRHLKAKVKGLYENLGRYEPTLPNKIANATDFYCDTLNFVAIRRFSAATVVFCCVRVTCCHKNFSVAIKIVIVATR